MACLAFLPSKSGSTAGGSRRCGTPGAISTEKAKPSHIATLFRTTARGRTRCSARRGCCTMRSSSTSGRNGSASRRPTVPKSRSDRSTMRSRPRSHRPPPLRADLHHSLPRWRVGATPAPTPALRCPRPSSPVPWPSSPWGCSAGPVSCAVRAPLPGRRRRSSRRRPPMRTSSTPRAAVPNASARRTPAFSRPDAGRLPPRLPLRACGKSRKGDAASRPLPVHRAT
mmetsp:Transcript_20480/g.59367  ORF Transcript_20480/g.59367 Transcript_20480/m.59367 type:complete len:226 (-) Transcript_20480:40-717(-)